MKPKIRTIFVILFATLVTDVALAEEIRERPK